MRDIRVDSNGKHRSWSSTATFHFRAKPFTARWNWRAGDPAKNGEVPVAFIVSNGLIEDGKVFTVKVDKKAAAEVQGDPNLKKTKKTVRIHPYENGPFGPLSQSVPPFYYFGYRGENLASRFEYFIKNAKSLGFDGWVVSKDGDHVVLGCEGKEILNRYTVALSQGGNLVRYQAEVRKGSMLVGREEWIWKWEKVKDAWLPVQLALQHDKFGEANGQAESLLSSSIRAIEWKTEALNEPIGEGEFTLSAIGVSPGDYITDVATGSMYEYGLADAPKSESSGTIRTVLIVGNAAVIILIAFLWYRRRSRSANA